MMRSIPYETLQVEAEGPVMRIWLSRPEARNALNDRMIAELTDCFQALAADPAVRVVQLGGRGPVFCAGADVEWLRQSVELTEEQNRRDAQTLADLLNLMNQTPQVLIVRAHGVAVGGAMGLCAVGDIVVAAEDTKFGFTEVRLGIAPAIISSFVYRKIGETYMRRYFLTGELFSADVAKAIGLVHEVVPAEALDGRVRELTEAVLAAGPQAVRTTKALTGLVTRLPFEAALSLGVDTTARLRVSPEGQEGLRAFLEKRKPQWPS
ncbi:Enoyl-CoA-hydratase [bacterium HR11]|nr:Enoyl-CoA-hydratase [bacterium HR11]